MSTETTPTKDSPRTVTDTDLAAIDATWQDTDDRFRILIRVVYGLIGLSRLGEHPVEVNRFAAYLDRSPAEAIALLEDNSGALFTTRVGDGLITLDLTRPERLQRRHLRISERSMAMSGCAPDLFQIAAVIDVPFRVEDVCPGTGAAIRVDFAPPHRAVDLIDAVDPSHTVVALDPQLLGQTATMTPEEIDTNLCAQMPFFADPDAAANWMSGHPTRRVLPVRDLHRLELVGYVRDAVRPRVRLTAGSH